VALRKTLKYTFLLFCCQVHNVRNDSKYYYAVYKHLIIYLCCSVHDAFYGLFYILLSLTKYARTGSTSKFWRVHKWLHAVLTNHTTNYHTNSADPMKTYQLICTSECEHKLFTLHTEPSNLRENKHHYQQAHMLATQRCDCASFRLLIVHTTIGQEVSEQNATESSLEEQQHNKQGPNVNTLVMTVQH